MLGVPAPL
uniref:Uncharacterized protein n=1 Tax=Nymphaea colorata TaxID=210225 RepID=A0A5K1E7D5_9MAGN